MNILEALKNWLIRFLDSPQESEVEKYLADHKVSTPYRIHHK